MRESFQAFFTARRDVLCLWDVNDNAHLIVLRGWDW